MYWKNYSKFIQSDYMERSYWHSSKAVYDYKGYRIIFDHYTFHSSVGIQSFESTVTRVYCQFESSKPMYLKICKATFLNRVLNIFNTSQFRIVDTRFNRMYQVFLNRGVSPAALNRSTTNKIMDLNVVELIIDNNDGIWGTALGKNIYELATYIDKDDLEFSVLNDIKALFEEIIDSLAINNQIKPVVEQQP
ncbi:hypothetical protein [Flavobacterium sp. NKUCC04_CG]|uniref:hypothetical protein n=1 Tax=Flavobacterium sp. NKUCC04_CG TaxID=2842121 RepID=UPI001C5AF052|nr:hypothetical protein [Flavobacterium sp. NKUCC04_CG]MBW3519863.1 hypothetical protein [Flavobacterium sp. NKUCC04_CG]